MSKRKSGWEKPQQLKKKEKEDFLLTKTYKLTLFFQVVEKEAGHISDNLHSNSPQFLLSQTLSKTKFSAMMMMMMMMMMM